jgi:predicted DNA-binding mobile mystery protein A
VTYWEVKNMNQDFQDLKRKQIDEKLSMFRRGNVPEVPRGGWAKTIRTALGMSSDALGKRLGISQSAVIQLEAGEEAGTASFASLRKLAGGLECDLVYALVPRTSLDEIVRKQALRRARTLVKSVAASMQLEDQGISGQEQNRQVEALARNLLSTPSTGFWDEE